MEEYLFVKMSCDNGECSGIIPAPSLNVKQIEYLVLYQNNANSAYKTRPVLMNSTNP